MKMPHSKPIVKATLFAVAFAALNSGLAHSETKCQYARDSNGVIHVRTSTSAQAYECMGYFHGLDRGWQIDHFKRIGQGRSAEVLGAGHIRVDFVLRLFDLAGQAHRLYLKLDEASRQKLDAYASGVNQGIKEALKRGAYEFQQLNYEPEVFLPEHALLVLLVQSFDQTRRSFEYRIEEYHVAEKKGVDWTQLKTQTNLPWNISVLDEKYSLRSSRGEQQSFQLPSGPHSPQAGWIEVFRESDSTGSNNWVVSKVRSKSGNAWLANDPHLDLKTPSFWYWIDIESPEEHKIGATVPGFPQVISGTNGKVAWGLTNAYLDYADIALINESELDRVAQEDRPTIWFKWWKFKLPFFLKTYRRTPEGSVVLPIDAPKGKAFVVHWGGVHYEPSDFAAVLLFSTAKSVDELSAHLSKAKISGWNFVFADQSGRVGYRATGRALLHHEEVPFAVQNRELSDLESPIFMNENQMPNFIDPPSGIISTANNRQFPSNAGLFGGRAYSAGFRAFRIQELLGQTRTHDFESLRQVQCDTQAIDARFLLPLMLAGVATDSLSQTEADAVKILTEWKYDTGASCKACGIYRRWVDRSLEELDVAESGLYRLLALNRHHEETHKALNRALHETVAELSNIGKGQFPSWESLHRVTFPHLSGDSVFDRDESFFSPGDEHSVNVGTVHWRGHYYEHTSGASQRVLVELSHPVRIYYRLPGTNRSEPPNHFMTETSPWKEWVRCTYSEESFGISGASTSDIQTIRLSASSAR